GCHSSGRLVDGANICPDRAANVVEQTTCVKRSTDKGEREHLVVGLRPPIRHPTVCEDVRQVGPGASADACKCAAHIPSAGSVGNHTLYDTSHPREWRDRTTRQSVHWDTTASVRPDLGERSCEVQRVTGPCAGRH